MVKLVSKNDKLEKIYFRYGIKKLGAKRIPHSINETTSDWIYLIKPLIISSKIICMSINTKSIILQNEVKYLGMNAQQPLNAAEQLLGITLINGWRVIEKINKGVDFSPGYFSVGYIVVSPDGKKAFLKALNYMLAFQSPDPAAELGYLTAAFLYERTILEKCRNLRLSKIITSITSGNITVANCPLPVDYLIFELADFELKQFLSISGNFDLAWILRSIHEVTIGLNQLHSNGIFHQDLKPSNVLILGEKDSKIGDLGRSTCDHIVAPHDSDVVIGDMSYAPPEQLYSYFDSDLRKRKISCDMYNLGSLIVFYFTNANMTASIYAELHDHHKWGAWAGTYWDVIPYLRAAYNTVLDRFETDMSAYNENLKIELVPIVRQLCDPDINLRGVRTKRRGISSQYSVYPYITIKS